MKVDKPGLAETLKRVGEGERELFQFAVSKQVEQENILPIFGIDGLGNIPVPVSIKDMKKLRKVSDAVCRNSGKKVPGSKVKKTSWLIDAGNIMRHGMTAEGFFLQTVPSLAADGLRKMGFDDSELTLIDIRPLHMLLCERGGFSPLSRNCEREEGMFGTMIVQIPVKNGYEGGLLKVSHRGDTRVFDHTTNSNRSFYSTIYYSGCEHELTEVTHGWRLVLTFNLCWKWSRPLFMPSPTDESLIWAAKEIQDILSAWQVPADDNQRLLAIPLEYPYTNASLSFAGLKGRDRVVASLLRSVDYIDLQLASICCGKKSETSTTSSSTYDQTLEEKEEYTTVDWFSSRTNSTFAFQGLEIDFDSELVLPMFPFSESRNFSGQTESQLDSFHRDAVLVIWPQTSTIDFACRYGFVGALDFLEFLAAKIPKEELLFVLGRTVAFCCANPGLVWNPAKTLPVCPGHVTYRLLQLCIDLESPSQGLILLNLISNDLPPSEQSTVQFEGLKTREVAFALAKFVQMAGWDDCEEGVLNLVSSETKIVVQMESLTTLVSSLLGYGFFSPAAKIADRICPFLFSPKFTWNSSTIVRATEMLFRLEAWIDSNNVERVVSFVRMVQRVETEDLCQAIVHVQNTLSEAIKRIPHMEKLYRELCQILVTRDLVNVQSVSPDRDSIIVEVARCLLWVDVWQILLDFLKQVTRPPAKGNNACLQYLVASGDVWKACQGSERSKKFLQILVDCRLRELSLLKPPVFSWEQTEAVMPKYPEVEAFLRSSQLSTTFSRKFSSVDEAKQWAVEAFGYGYEVLSSPDSRFFHDHYYSATVRVKKIGGGQAVCVITKNRRYHEYAERQFELHQQELTELLQRRRSESAEGSSVRPPKRRSESAEESCVRPPKRVKFNLP